MLGALKTWALRQKSGKFTPLATSTEFKNSGCVLTSHSSLACDGGLDEFQAEVVGYGHLLCCPICQEFYTHPVLLPCQHSMCYGCARSQLLSSESCTKVTDTLAASHSDYSLSTLSDATSPYNSKLLNKSCQSLLTASPIYLEKRTKTNFCTSSPKDFASKHHPSSAMGSISSLRYVKASNLHRSNSTSSIARSVTGSLRHQEKVSGSLKQSRVTSLFCPTCETSVHLGKLGISGLFRNFALESIVERFRSAAKAAVAIRCGYCKPPASDATKSCLNCKLSYCNECFKSVHIWGTKKARHGYMAPTNNFTRPKILLCPEHSYEVSMYCNKCKKSVCRMCKLGGAHVNHLVSPAISACRKGKERLYADLDELKRKKEILDRKISATDEAFVNLERNEAETRGSIQASLDDVHHLLESKRTDLLAKVDAQVQEKQNILRQDMLRHQKHLRLASVANFAEEVLKESEPNFFLQTSQMVEIQMKEALECLSEVNDAGADVQPIVLHLDFDSLKKHLNAIDIAFPEPNKSLSRQNKTFSEFQSNRMYHYTSFQWMPTEKTSEVIIDDIAHTAQINTTSATPCIIKGNTPFCDGEHYWEVMVTSDCARKIIVGVCNLRTDEKLHGSINQSRHGAFLTVTPGSAAVLNGEQNMNDNWVMLSEDDVLKTSQRFFIGKHSFIVGIHLKIFEDEAYASFYNVHIGKKSKEAEILFERTLSSVPPYHPIVAMSGQGTVKVV